MVKKKSIQKAIKTGKKAINKATKPKHPDLGKVLAGAAAGVIAAVGVKKLQNKKTRNTLKKELSLAASKFKKEMELIESKFAKEYPEVKKELLDVKAKLSKGLEKSIETAKDFAEKAHEQMQKTSGKSHTVKVTKKAAKKTTKKAVKKVAKKAKK